MTIVEFAVGYPPLDWQEHQRLSHRRQALLRYLTLCELHSIERGPLEERALWPLVYRDLTAMRIASGREAVAY